MTSIDIKNLNKISFEQLANCFNKAFSDYIVPVSVTSEYLKYRSKRQLIDFNLSYGAFAGDDLVGLVLIGVSESSEGKRLYNGGTGVIPEYRGRGLTKQIFSEVLTKARIDNSISGLSLEVIKGNDRALKIYEEIGFNAIRTLNFYSGYIKLNSDKNIQGILIRDFDLKEVEQLIPLWDFIPAWENGWDAIWNVKDTYRYLGAYKDHELVGYIVINPENGYIPQFFVKKSCRKRGIGSLIFQQAMDLSSKLVINNVDYNALEVNELLLKLGLKLTVQQYEMHMELNPV